MIYISGEFIRAVFWSSVGIVLLILLLDGSDQANFMSTRGIPPLYGLYNSLFKLPDFLLKTLPLIILISGIITFARLSKSLEIVAAKTSGFKFSNIVFGPVILTLFIGTAATVALNPLASLTNSLSNQYLISLGITKPTEIQVGTDGIFLREIVGQQHIITKADKINSVGTELYNVTRLEFTRENVLIQRIQATTANLKEGSWLMKDTTIWKKFSINGIKKMSKNNLTNLEVDTTITQEQILNSFSDPSMISFWKLPKFIMQLQKSGFEARKHLRYVQTELARPLILLAMLLIGCAFATTTIIRKSISSIIVMSLLSGFGLYSFDRLAATLADNNQLPIFLAAFGPPLCGIFLSLTILIFREEVR